MSIQVQNISKKFGEIQALQNISLDIDKAELFGLIGPDGAGKTTLMRIISSLMIPDEGEAFLCGYHTVKEYRKIRNIVGYMPGRFSLYQDLTVEENLNFYASVFGTSIQENYDLIKDIYEQIKDFKNRRAGKLSGGMKQKLALCCALIHKPKVLILDEPTTGVDAVSRKEFWDMLRKFKEFGISILVSTPYMDEAGLCDRVALMQNGKILKVDTPGRIMKSFAKKLYAIRSENIYKLLNDLRLYEDTRSAFSFGQEVHYTSLSGNTEPAIIESYLHENGHKNVQIKCIEAGIEDCFMDIMD